jgi:hypothetical protein
MTRALVKASNDAVCFCECDTAFAATGQLDCPWCGCGWLFTCTSCRRAFTFAKIEETAYSHDDIARRSFESRHGRLGGPNEQDTISREGEWLGHLAENAALNMRLVFLDGRVLPASAKDINFAGWYAHHELDHLPHLLPDAPARLEALFGQVSYWTDRKIEGRHE